MTEASRPDTILASASHLPTEELYTQFVEAKPNAGRAPRALEAYEYRIRPDEVTAVWSRSRSLPLILGELFRLEVVPAEVP